jgi:hypothetical protein
LVSSKKWGVEFIKYNRTGQGLVRVR